MFVVECRADVSDWRLSCDWIVLLDDGRAILTRNEDSSPPGIVGREGRNTVLAAIQGEREARRLRRLQDEYWSTLHRFPLTAEQDRRSKLSLAETIREVWTPDSLGLHDSPPLFRWR